MENPTSRENIPQTKLRLDCLLVERGIYESREKAQRAILAGEVRIGPGNQRADKAGTRVRSDIEIHVDQKCRYVSRGGLKLEAALAHFQINPQDKTAIDIGASTGGFTDCLLQHGAKRVYAIDVGHGQLDWKIRSDSRVEVREKVNARYAQAEDFPETITLAVIDVSFISLTHILPAACRILKTGGEIIALIKPQFELGREEVSRGAGVIRDPEAHDRAIVKVKQFVAEDLSFTLNPMQLHCQWLGVMPSPILGAEGNKEFLTCLKLSRLDL